MKRFADSRHRDVCRCHDRVLCRLSRCRRVNRLPTSPASLIVKSLGVRQRSVRPGRGQRRRRRPSWRPPGNTVHVLDGDEQAVERAHEQLRPTGLYGLVSAERLPRSGGLPYTENLVNLLFIAEIRPGAVGGGDADPLPQQDLVGSEGDRGRAGVIGLWLSGKWATAAR